MIEAYTYAFEYETKHSVRYVAQQADAPMQTIYVKKAFLMARKENGEWPKTISFSVLEA